jgi:hypothetical protein
MGAIVFHFDHIKTFLKGLILNIIHTVLLKQFPVRFRTHRKFQSTAADYLLMRNI